jgi:hypothetical protein
LNNFTTYFLIRPAIFRGEGMLGAERFQLSRLWLSIIVATYVTSRLGKESPTLELQILKMKSYLSKLAAVLGEA